jgi:effector-binding domain-containing protein
MSFNPAYMRRSAQPYLAIRARMVRDALATTAPQLLAELTAWLAAHAVAPIGAPLIRYFVVDYNTAEVEIDLGVPVENAAPEDKRVRSGVLPGGQYVVVTHAGSYDGLVDTTAELLAWGEAHHVRWQVEEKDHVTKWAGRVEHYLVGPPRETDPARWQTEIAILVAG